MTQYRHNDCGGFAQEHTFSSGEPYYICSHCLCSVGGDSVTEVSEDE